MTATYCLNPPTSFYSDLLCRKFDLNYKNADSQNAVFGNFLPKNYKYIINIFLFTNCVSRCQGATANVLIFSGSIKTKRMMAHHFKFNSNQTVKSASIVHMQHMTVIHASVSHAIVHEINLYDGSVNDLLCYCVEAARQSEII